MSFPPGFLFLLCLAMQLASSHAIGATIPDDISAQIEAWAATEFPDDHAQRNREIRAQARAYEEIRDYEDKRLSAKLLAQIKTMARQQHPLDFSAQLSWLNRSVHSYLQLGRLSTGSFTGGITSCRKLKWRVTNKPGREMYYRGTLAPGSADTIYLIVGSGREVIGQNFAFPKPDGSWEISIWGDYEKAIPRREKFRCEKL